MKRYLITHSLEPFDQMICLALGVQLVKVVQAQVAIDATIANQVERDYQLRMPDRNCCTLFSTPSTQPTILPHEVLALGPACRPCRLAQETPQPAIPIRAAAALALPGTLMVARTHPRPGTQMFRIAKTAHVGADLRDQRG